MTVHSTSRSVFDADLPILEYDITTPPQDVYPQLAAAQRVAPFALGPLGPEMLSYDLARTVLRDNTRFQIPSGYMLSVQGITSGRLFDKVVNSLLGLEGDDHQRVRSVVSKAFTPRAVERLHETIATVIDDVVEPVAQRGECDVVVDISRPFPVSIICALLGAPREDWEKFSLWTDDIFKAFTFPFSPDDEPAVMSAWDELDAYVDDMVDRRRHSATEDLLSDLIRAEHEGDRLTGEELRMLVASLLLAGTDTTRNQVSASIDVMCDHPDQWELLRANPELAMAAVDETIRHSSISNSLMRVVAEDVDLAGVVFPAGTTVFANIAAANRDPAIYDNPDCVDITREGLPPLLTFGAGVHFCLGANLARLEIAEALKAVTRRLSNPRRTGPAPWKPMIGLSGPFSLPIAYDS